jgi:hypothetical protein
LCSKPLGSVNLADPAFLEAGLATGLLVFGFTDRNTFFVLPLAEQLLGANPLLVLRYIAELKPPFGNTTGKTRGRINGSSGWEEARSIA